MILVVSHPDDLHASAVEAVLDARGVRWARLDLASFPERGSFSHAFPSTRPAEVRVRVNGAPDLALRDVHAVWWRRPRPFRSTRLPLPEHRTFAEGEWRAAMLGALQGLDVHWVNHPFAADAAALKPWQLLLARQAGLRIPRTLVTSDPADARVFLRGRGPFVYKTLHGERERWRPTRRVGAAERRLLGAVHHAPVIFQELVPGVDVRVTVVGRRLFPVEIDARRSASPDDFRVDFTGSEVRRCRLPAAVATRLLRMTRRMGLAYAAFDLRRRRNGEHVFLEVNPGGEWLGFEETTGVAITDAVARLLASGARTAKRRPPRATARPSPWLP